MLSMDTHCAKALPNVKKLSVAISEESPKESVAKLFVFAMQHQKTQKVNALPRNRTAVVPATTGSTNHYTRKTRS